MGDPPERSIQLPIPIRLKDIVVLGTDGLFDNVELDEIIGIIQNSVDLQTGMLNDKQKVAEQLAQLGH
jgi:serine/threonine protein phosphatase PrpC